MIKQFNLLLTSKILIHLLLYVKRPRLELVQNPPIDPNAPSTNSKFVFTALDTQPNDEIHWDFGDGTSTDTIRPVEHIFTLPP